MPDIYSMWTNRMDKLFSESVNNGWNFEHEVVGSASMSFLRNIINTASYRASCCYFYYPAAVPFPNLPQSTSCWPSADSVVAIISVCVFVMQPSFRRRSYSIKDLLLHYWLFSVTIHSFNKDLQRFKQKFMCPTKDTIFLCCKIFAVLQLK